MQTLSVQQLSAIAVILDRPGLSDLRLLCSTARVCSTWQAAVAASGTAVDVTFTADAVTLFGQNLVVLLQRESSFAAWLCSYGHLARSITLHGFASLDSAAASTACQLLATAMQLLAAGSRAMRLQCFESDITSAAASRSLLTALPSSLTELALPTQFAAAAPEAVDAALTRLTNLRKLSIKQQGGIFDLQLRALSSLTGLTCLELCGDVEKDCIRSLWDAAAAVPSVQQLSLDLQTYEEVSVGYSLSDRTALTQLHLGLSDRGLADVELPAQLQELSLRLLQLPDGSQPLTSLKLRELKQLRRLRLMCCECPLSDFADSFEVLKALTQLEALELEYKSFSTHLLDVDMQEWLTLPKITALSSTVPEGARHIFADVTVGIEVGQLGFVQLLHGLTRLELNLATHNGQHNGQLQVLAVCGPAARAL